MLMIIIYGLLILNVLSFCSVLAGIDVHLEEVWITDNLSSFSIKFVTISFIIFSVSYMGLLYYY